ncbi:type II toxin-antitoxin system YafO family toxin [Winslowiella sp. 2C04]|uniref:type II toxin-antitoxin system YafO family toxin n=1 Tax=Winslowiella sp. 2C04 TaxID=3416179 RepID=UPI003CF0A52C
MDHIEVSINSHTKEEFFNEAFFRFPELEASILQDFQRYKATGELPHYFGRDVAYTQPYSAFRSGLMHIHLCLPPNSFPKNRPQNDRVCKRDDPERDACLVYVQGELYENRYSLIAIMHPDAHEKARQHSIMSYLSTVAQDFKDNN